MRAALLALLLAGCSSAPPVSVPPQAYRVTLFAQDGSFVKQWMAKGTPSSTGENDCFHFVDALSGKQVDACGTVIVEEQ